MNYIYELYVLIVCMVRIGTLSLFSLLSSFRTTLKKVDLVIQQISWMIFLTDSFFIRILFCIVRVSRVFANYFSICLFIGYYLTAFRIRFDNF